MLNVNRGNIKLNFEQLAENLCGHNSTQCKEDVNQNQEVTNEAKGLLNKQKRC